MWDIENSHEWVLHTVANGSNDELNTIATVLWGIWFARNKCIFENKSMTTAAVVAWSRKQIRDWQLANKHNSPAFSVRGTNQESDLKWKLPEAWCMKINVDASITEGQNSFAIGMVLRNHLGGYIAGRTMKFAGNVSVMEAELTGIVEALLWAREVVVVGVVIESDSLLSIQAIQQGQENMLEAGDLMEHCINIMSNDARLSLKFVRKQANKVAHKISRFPCELNSLIVIPSPLIYLLETLLSGSLLI